MTTAVLIGGSDKVGNTLASAATLRRVRGGRWLHVVIEGSGVCDSFMTDSHEYLL